MQLRRDIPQFQNFKKILLLIAVFVFAQLASVTHAHDEHGDGDESPVHTTCSVCLIASEVDEDMELESESEPSGSDNPFLNPSSFAVTNVVGSEPPTDKTRNSPLIDKAGQPYLQSRAPPVG